MAGKEGKGVLRGGRNGLADAVGAAAADQMVAVQRVAVWREATASWVEVTAAAEKMAMVTVVARRAMAPTAATATEEVEMVPGPQAVEEKLEVAHEVA